jgi:hypothetical protein
MRHFPIGFLCTLMLTFSFGCATSLNGGDKLLKFHDKDDESFASAPKAGKYVVAYRQAGSGELWQAKGTQRKVKKGEELGFTRDDMGRLVAVAGRFEKTLGQMPMIAEYACWYRLPDDYDRKRQFDKNLRQTVKTVAGVAIVGGLIAGDLALEGLADQDDSDDWADSSTQHRDRSPRHRLER